MGLKNCSKIETDSTKIIKETEQNKKADNLEELFKKNYLTWIDLKLNGDICNETYLNELKEVQVGFSDAYNLSKKKKVWKSLTKEDKAIYLAYGEVADLLKKMNQLIEDGSYEKAVGVLNEIKVVEPSI